MPTIIEFFSASDDRVIGTVEITADSLHSSVPALADMVRSTWLRLGKAPRKTAAYFASWSNGYLASRPAEPPPDDIDDTT